jgi:hypothetical protein
VISNAFGSVIELYGEGVLSCDITEGISTNLYINCIGDSSVVSEEPKVPTILICNYIGYSSL